ncbi:hypothetical protein GWK16_11420 [Roseomonas sp. JC162]|uniref:Peptidase C1A papain C-terminal domain-containing protein n=1 Tax=Neoroseomonas marina TaxID=1232220 RepID=A0A848EEH5_9PROT|nr:hypothetical protein [Neoroseomonas marina]NMJ41853.1 hypothetical protein [Neoroseomonas marina]
MTWPFLQTAAAELGLQPEQVAFLRDAAIRSYDALHSVLAASPSLDRLSPALERRKLLALLEPMLSDAYRAALAQPQPRIAIPSGARSARDGAVAGPPADWPSHNRPVKLGDEPADLLAGGVRGLWGLRDQAAAPTCVGFAAAGAMELARRTQGQAPPDFSAIFLYNRILARGSQAADAANGATKLTEARQVLADLGICRRADWPDDRPRDDQPSDAALHAAQKERTDAVVSYDLGDPDVVPRPPGVARTVLDLLRSNPPRPVAIALPEFRDQDAPANGPSNWWQDDPVVSGILSDPTPNMVRLDSGHAVCVVGFQTDATEPLGGWFIFRNSMGSRWATGAPDFSRRPVVPGRGFGAISATHVDRHVWEIFSPAARPGP